MDADSGDGPGDFAEAYLGYLLARAAHLFNAGAHVHARAAGLSVVEWRVLATLSGRGRMGVGALAAAVLIQQPTLTKALDRMAERGLVERSASVADRRVVHVSITGAGRERVAPVLAAAKSHEAEFLGALPPAESARLKALLRDLIGRLEADPAQRR